MKLKEISYDLAVQFEMLITTMLEKKFYSERNRKQNIVAGWKEICRQNMDRLDNDYERAKLYSKSLSIYNRLFMELTDEEFYCFMREFIEELKASGVDSSVVRPVLYEQMKNNYPELAEQSNSAKAGRLHQI